MEPELHTLAGAYALDALDSDERTAFQEHLAVCDACASEVVELRLTAARLGAAAYEQPPGDMRSNVLGMIDRTRQQAPVVALASRRKNRLSAFVAAAAAIVAIAGLSTAVVNLLDRVDRLEVRATELIGIINEDFTTVHLDGPGSVQMLVAGDGHTALLVATDLQRPPEGLDYQLWLIGDQVASAGLLAVGTDGLVVLPVEADFGSVQTVAVSVEPAGGSPSPTSEPFLVGNLA